MPFTTTIEGLGGAQFTGSDYTNPALIQSFLTSMTQFYKVKTGGAPTASDLANIQNQINFLREIAKNGVSINLDPNNPGNPVPGGINPGTSPNRTFYLTTDMVQILNNLTTSLSRVGDLNNLTLAELDNWRSGTLAQNTSDIQNIFVKLARAFAVLPIDPSTITTLKPNGVQSAISLVPATAAQQIDRIFSQGNTFALDSSFNESTTRSLQAFTELHYVETANQVINDQLQNMKQALQTTKTALDGLNTLQQLHNNIQVTSRTFTYNLAPPSTQARLQPNINIYVAEYERYASAQLKAALVPQLSNEFLPFSLPSAAVEITATDNFPVPDNLTALVILAKAGIPSDPNPAVNIQAANNHLSSLGPLRRPWTFSVRILDPTKYYAFNTSTNQFTPIPVLGIYKMDGYYVASATVNPATFTRDQMAKIVGDGFNGVQKFPLIGTLSGMNTIQLQMLSSVVQMSALLATLAYNGPILALRVTPASTLNSPLLRSQALVGQISAVLTDLKNNLSTTTTTTATLTAAVGIRKWIMDNYQTFASASATNAGAIQQKLTNAINAAQSSNSTQTQKVNNSLLVFQQYYQSAAAVLTALTQIITKMAQKISQ